MGVFIYKKKSWRKVSFLKHINIFYQIFDIFIYREPPTIPKNPQNKYITQFFESISSVETDSNNSINFQDEPHWSKTCLQLQDIANENVTSTCNGLDVLYSINGDTLYDIKV